MTPGEIGVLEKGLNYAVTPKIIPTQEILASCEKGLRNVREQADVELARTKITQTLRHAKVPRLNLTMEEENALNELRSDKSIKILKADKGNCTAVMDSEDYEEKISNLLSDSATYQIIHLVPVL